MIRSLDRLHAALRALVFSGSILALAVSQHALFVWGVEPGGSATVAKWKNESYMTTLIQDAEGKWREVFDKNGQLHLTYREVGRNKDYIELYCDQRKYAIRLLANKMELKKAEKWEWAANGKWLGPAPQAGEAAASTTTPSAPSVSETPLRSPTELSGVSTDPVLREFLRFCYSIHTSIVELNTLEKRVDGLDYLLFAVKDAKNVAASVAEGMARDGELSERKVGRYSSKFESKMRELHVKRATAHATALERDYQRWLDGLKKSNRETRSGPYYSLWQAWVRTTKAREDLLFLKFKALKTGMPPDAKSLDAAARRSLKLTDEFKALLSEHPDWIKYGGIWEIARDPKEAGNKQVVSLVESGRYFNTINESSVVERQLSPDNPQTNAEHKREVLSDRKAALAITNKEFKF